MPNSLQVGMISSSTSLDHKLYSNYIAEIGWTACASLIVFAEASERPTYLIRPSLTSFFISYIVSFIGVDVSIR